MSELENFISRWGRLKRLAELKRARETGLREYATSSSTAATTAASGAAGAKMPGCAAPAFDPASLPSIDSITASTDIREFLLSGVPAELMRTALRRVWVTDPVIRNFIGIADNQWDFTDPAAIPGFGPLQATCDAPDLIARAVTRLDKSLERSAARLPDNFSASERLPSAADDSQCSRIDDKTGSAQTALVARKSRGASESKPASENNQLETGPQQQSRSQESMSLRRVRHAHGSAMPR